MTESEDFTHLDSKGNAHMVDVGEKDITSRSALAKGRVSMSAETAAALSGGSLPKGDVLGTARIAAIQAAKRTGDLIPLCHPLKLDGITVEFETGESFVEVHVRVNATDRTGVEMEALTACAVACLTVYDMCKSKDKSMEISEICLLEKTGGRSGDYKRS